MGWLTFPDSTTTQSPNTLAIICKLIQPYRKGIPANYLINPNGEIVAKDLLGAELERKLAEIMK